jgi:hypothetical protein
LGRVSSILVSQRSVQSLHSPACEVRIVLGDAVEPRAERGGDRVAEEQHVGRLRWREEARQRAEVDATPRRRRLCGRRRRHPWLTLDRLRGRGGRRRVRTRGRQHERGDETRDRDRCEHRRPRDAERAAPNRPLDQVIGRGGEREGRREPRGQ